ncbi:MAG: histidinol-phosphate transaminase [Pseudomonadota bacterium]
MNPAIADLVRPHFRTMKGYVSAGMEAGKDATRVFMNANENPFELPGLEGFNRYPEPQPPVLLDAYAKRYGVDADQVVATRGADEAIAVITKLFCEPGADGVVICPPAFGMYKVNALAAPASAIEVPLVETDGQFSVNTRAVIESAKNPHCKLVFLCSPNNPTGNSLPLSDLQAICAATTGYSMVILDETYIDFAEQESMVNWLGDYPNLIVLRTMSKSYSMAGMRMGGLLNSDSEFVQLVRSKCLDAYPLTKTSIDAALLALSDDLQPQVQANINTLREERRRLAAALQSASFVTKIYPSDANFLLVALNCVQELLAYAAQQNIVLRDFSQQPLTPNCIRISVGTPAQNDQLIELLSTFHV